ncbi:MAG: type transport system permease protein [Acidimicrobiaceae bacterium]
MTVTTARTVDRGSKQHSASSLAVAMSLAVRSIVNVFRVPGAFVPVLVMPIFFLLSFSGSFSGLARSGILPTRNMLSWVMPYAILQGAAFAGMGATFSVARDLEGGFYDRLLLAPAPRRALLFGPVLSAMLRSLIPVAVVCTFAFVGGARLSAGLFGLVPMLVAAMAVAAIACLWGLGIAFRFRTQRSLALVQVGIFSAMFLSASQVPVRAIEGWVQPVARVNPLTNILRLAREGFLPGGVTWHDTWGGLTAIVVAAALLAWFAVRGLRQVLH